MNSYRIVLGNNKAGTTFELLLIRQKGLDKGEIADN